MNRNLGNLLTQTDARGCITTLSYDGLNRLTDKVYSGTCNSTVDVGYTYDAFMSGSNYGRGYRTGMTDASGSATWKVDTRGRVTEELKVLGSDSFKTQWSYNSNDSLAWMKYPADNTGALGEQVNYTYHPQGALNTMANTTPYTFVQETKYNEAGQVELRTLGSNLLKTDYVYFGWGEANGQRRLKRILSGTIANPSSLQDLRYYDTTTLAAWYDGVGNLLQIADYRAGPQTQSFTYDAADRILTAGASGGSSGNYSETYSYNSGTGNLAVKAGVSYTYGDANHKHAVTSFSNNTYGYDNNGNMTSRNIGGTVFTLAYDAENHLTGVSGGATATFWYDGDGRRVKATVGGTTTIYIGDYLEWTGSTSTRVSYYYANGTRIAMRVGNTRYWLFSDHLGSTAITANSSGTSIGELRYKAWGEQRYSSGTTYTKRHFTSQYQESTLGGLEGLYFYNSRWYDSSLGRFAQADSIIPEPGNPQAWDRFAYGLNNPVKYIDPSGNRTCTAEEAATGDETCSQNITDIGGPVIHRVFMGGFYASAPDQPKDQLPESNPLSITNPLIWLSEFIGLIENLVQPRISGDNVFTYLTYSESDNGNVDNFSISMINQSDQSIYLAYVKFLTQRWDDGYAKNLPSCVECGVFYARSTINDYLSTIGPQSSTDVNLSTYPSNPTVSITPDYGFPPFSGNVNVLVTAYMYANTEFGLWNFQTSAQIYAPRPWYR